MAAGRAAFLVSLVSPATLALQLNAAPQLRRTLPRLVRLHGPRLDATDAETARLAADKANLQAERAALQAEILALKGQRIKLESDAPARSSPPSPPSVPVVAASTSSSSTVEDVCRVLDGIPAPGVDVLQRSVAIAWEAGRRQQVQEIATLESRIKLAEELKRAEAPEEELDFGEKSARAVLFLEEAERSRKAGLNLDALWQLSENRSFDGPTERRARVRALTRQAFAFLLGKEEGDEAEQQRVAVPGEGLVSLTGSKARLRSLRRHEAAGLVEYRYFAAELAKESELGAALQLDDLVDEEASMRAVQTLFSRFVFKSNRETYQEILDELKEEQDEESEETVQVFQQAAEGTIDTPLERWLQLLADILSKTNFLQAEAEVMEGVEVALEADEPDSMDQVMTLAAGLFSSLAFPALLMSQCARQGCFEAIPIYTTARLLAAANVEALARHEGFDVPSEPQKTVSEQEGLLVRADVKEVISGFSSVFVFLWAVLTLLLLFLIYQVATFAYGLAFPAVDPLAF